MWHLHRQHDVACWVWREITVAEEAWARIMSSPSRNHAGKPLSKWLVNQKMGKNEDVDERRAVFVVSHP